MYKKSLIVICIIICLFSITCVSASENDTIMIIDNNDDVISQSGSELLTDSPGTFTDLANEIANAGNELNLNRNYTYDREIDQYIQIKINKSIVINGNGFTINGNYGEVGAFNITSSNVVLNNIVFDNLKSVYGGAVYWGGVNGTLSDCSFIGCRAQNDGGAVFWHKDALNGTLSGCSFVGCRCTYGDGGAVEWEGANGALSDCSFIGCYAENNGGAVYWMGVNGALSDCNFVNCSSPYGYLYRGGAVYWNTRALKGTLSGCSFVNCSAIQGGAVYWRSNDGAIVESSFKNCSAIYTYSDDYDCNGGAVYLSGNWSAVADCIFIDCSATDYGGGIYFSGMNCSLINPGFEGCIASEGSDWYSVNSLNVTGIAVIVISTSDIYVGEDLIVDVLVSDDATGSVTLSVNNKNYTNDLVNSRASFTVSGLSVGTYDIIVYYSGDATFNATRASTKVKVSEPDIIIISVQDLVKHYQDPDKLIINVTKNGSPVVNEAITIIFHYEDFPDIYYKRTTNANGQATMNINLMAGTYNATVSYQNISVPVKVTVLKANAVISASNVSFTYKDPNSELSATMTNENGRSAFRENLNFDLNGKTYTAMTDSTGKASILIDALPPGTYTATISYNGTNYEASAITALVTVTKAGTVISAPDVNVSYSNPSGELVATIVNEHGKPLVVNLNVNLNGKDYTVKTDSDGRASLAIGTLSPGTYTATISYKGSGNYKASTTTAKVTVTKSTTVISAPDANITYKDPSGALVATMTNEHGKPLVVNLNVELNGKTYTVRTDSNGQASVPLDTLTPGTYTATISYKGSSNYKTSTVTAKVTVSKSDTIISAPDANITYKDPNGELVATIINEHGKPLVVTLSVNINGKTYTVKTDSNGQAIIPIDTLTPGTYTATISYKGSNNYKATTATAKVTVTKSATVISAPNVNIAYKDPNGELVATITNEHGKPLVVNLNIKLNGKTYTVKTDSNGQASIAIDTLTPGTYTATISYKGSGNYKASTVTTNVTVTKADTIISAPNVKIAYKDPSGELIATITNEHGKPLVVNLNIKLNGKTYTVKTDSNGQTSIAIGTLSPGKYTATISYKGSSNYKASTATAKVTVTKAGTVLSAQDVTIAYKKPFGILVATITDERGNPLIVTLNGNINGVNSTARSDFYQAGFLVGLLKPGEYTATISYKGSANYKASNTTAKVTIIKADTTIIAYDVSVVYNDTWGELDAWIFNEHGEQIIGNLDVELNGKTYTAKPDSGGMISVSTKDLNPGTYKAKLSYKGSSNYNPTSTTVDITVKP